MFELARITSEKAKRPYGRIRRYVRGLKRETSFALVESHPCHAVVGRRRLRHYVRMGRVGLLVAAGLAELDKQDVINGNGDARRLLHDYRKLRAAQNQLAAQLVMTPAIRASICTIANKDKEIDLVTSMALAQAEDPPADDPPGQEAPLDDPPDEEPPMKEPGKPPPMKSA